MLIAAVILISALLVVIDQVIKYLVEQNLKPLGSINVIDGLFSLVYSENRGAAFGIFQNETIFFSVITVLMISFFMYLLISKHLKGLLFTASVTMIIGGGIGNLIDRIFRGEQLFKGYVIDYMSVSFFPPIFNFADCCITIGAALFIISVLFFYNPDNIVLSKKSKTSGEEDE